MQKPIPPRDKYLLPLASLLPFLLIAFGLAWSIVALFIFQSEFMTRTFGNLTGQHPLFFLCVYSPAIAAFILISYYSGLKGLTLYLSRLFLWRCSVAWYAFIVIGIPLVFYVGAAIKGTLFETPFPYDSIQALFMALVLSAIKGPIEEFGWRGLALPLLQRSFTPFWASLILGVIWGTWHFPAFLLSGTQQSNWAFAPFFLGCIALSIIATALFNASQGSILLAAFFHFMLMNPIFPDAEPFDSYLLVLIVIPIIWYNRKMMFTKEKSVTEVIPSNTKHLLVD
jgi:membrane protease YdiL (CAAX protease family)